MKFLYILRHGQTEYNRKGVLQGRAIDAPLNQLGWQQTEAFYKYYKNEGFELVISSELQRSIQSIRPFVESGVSHKIDERITEFSWGINEGTALDDLVISNYKNMLNAWSEGQLDASIEGGESGRELLERVKSFRDYILKRNEEKILICTHGRTLKMLIVTLMGWAMSDMEKVRHSNAALFQLEKKSKGFEFIKDNDLSHLPEDLHHNTYWDK